MTWQSRTPEHSRVCRPSRRAHAAPCGAGVLLILLPLVQERAWQGPAKWLLLLAGPAHRPGLVALTRPGLCPFVRRIPSRDAADLRNLRRESGLDLERRPAHRPRRRERGISHAGRRRLGGADVRRAGGGRRRGGHPRDRGAGGEAGRRGRLRAPRHLRQRPVPGARLAHPRRR
ncbi:hypothetical protein DMB66_36720 [Actinoplanes sp. ATCC 53533]|nr:hypothetical protein DMB66_36720 [Actinoplanes sp. ATCC 53533]